MVNTDFQKVISGFIPPEERRVLLDQVVAGCKERGMQLTRRTLQYFSGEGMISKPIRIGRQAFYDKSIFDEVAALFILKDVFHLSHERIKEMLQGGATNVKDIAEAFYGVLSEYFHWDPDKNTRALIFEVANTKKSERVIDDLVEEISGGVEPDSIDVKAFVKKYKTIQIKGRNG